MLATITPLGERSRGMSWGATSSWYLVGAVFSASIMGFAMGTVGRLLIPARPVSLFALAALSLAVAAVEWTHGLRTYPGPRRQVNDMWLRRYRGWAYGLGFGLQLGAGVATIVVTPSIYLVVATALVGRAPLAGSLIMGVFGATRGAEVLLTHNITRPERVARVPQLLERFNNLSKVATVGAEVALGVAVIARAI